MRTNLGAMANHAPLHAPQPAPLATRRQDGRPDGRGLLTRRTFLLSSVLALSGCKGGEDLPADGVAADAATPSPPAAPAPSAPNLADFAFRISSPQAPIIVPRTLAGANYLAPYDLLDGTFGARALDLGVTLLRWPGGALTERWQRFLGTYIDNADQTDWSTFSHQEPWSLPSFLSWTEQRGIVPTIVLPTKKYFDGVTMDLSRAQAELGAFVSAVTSGTFGGSRVEVFELGNEFMWEDKLPADLYGRFARDIVPALRQSAHYPIRIGVQGGRFMDNSIYTVPAEWSQAQIDDVDFIIDHIYTRRYAYDSYPRRMRTYRLLWGRKPIYISEWNVKSDTAPDLAFASYGIEQAAAMLHIWDSMITGGVEFAAFWAIQQHNWTSAYPREGVSPGIAPFFGGATLRWLTATVGSTRLDTTQIGSDGMYATAFRDEAGIVTVFVAGLEAGLQDVSILLEGARILSVSGMSMHGEADVAEGHPSFASLSPSVDGNVVTFTINRHTPQELVRLRIATEPA